MGSRLVDDGPVPARATYSNLYKWPESDARFIKSIIHHDLRDGGDGRRSCEPEVVDGFSCRQLYLRSYIFSRKEDYTAIKCLGRVKDKIKTRLCDGRRRKLGDSILRRLLCCAIKIEVID